MDSMTTPLLYDSRAGSMPRVTAVGGKALNLWRLHRMGQPVPAWFCVTTAAYRRALAAAGLEDGASASGEVLRERIAGMPLPADLERVLREQAAALLAEGGGVAVRSSAADEDGAGQSFAGLHDSFLYVTDVAGVLTAVRRVWASAFNARALAYRRERGLPVAGLAVAVIVQRMIEAQVSGVMFTANPVTGNALELLISAVYGAGEGLVSEGFAADTFTVAKRGGAIHAEVVEKTERMDRATGSGGGTVKAAVGAALRLAPALTDTQIRRLAAVGLLVESAYGRPQDIEFCFDATGRLHLLQARPITTASAYGPAAGQPLIWDNSNIIESYSGVTSPMTFSFIRRAYTIVYHCFSEVMGIPPAVIKANRGTFENMLGLIRGQVYYNLRNWYRLVALFPGFNYNRQFMESMMGVKQPLEDGNAAGAAVDAPSWGRRTFVELPRLLRLLATSSWHFLRIRRRVGDFQDNFSRNYARWSAMEFRGMRPHELMAVYREMEDRLLWHWKAPIINDFFVMVFYGSLKSLCARWCGDTQGSLQNDLICGEGGIESTEPTMMLMRLARLAMDTPGLRQRIESTADDALVDAVHADPAYGAFAAMFDSYLERYGFRCMNELKLEEYSLRDRPGFVFKVLRNYLGLARPEALDVGRMQAREGDIRRRAEALAFSRIGSLRGAFWRKPLFVRVLANARLGVKNRENMRFARTRIYGLLRELLRALGGHFAAEGILADAEDIFYLTLDECWDYIKGSAVTVDLAGLVRLRRAEFEAFRDDAAAMPDDRFETFGMVYHRNPFRDVAVDVPPPADGLMRGVGCCPGEVTGAVKVLLTPRDDIALSGEILVAERTDPGWVPLYPSVSGLLIERGSILSHSAIVAREMGIPTIVGIPGLTKRLVSGQVVTMNGAAGTVELR